MRSQALGERESGTARLEEAVAAYRAALKERTRERVPLDWAGTQNNLGNALWRLGERESGTARLEEAVAAYRAALEERTRERVPLDWATTQNNLGTALSDAGRAGERDGAAGGGGGGLSRGAGGTDARAGSARLGDDAEQSRQCARRRSASGRAGRRGWRRRWRPIARRWRNRRASGCRSTGRRRRTISAMRSQTLGERESGTARLEEAVAAYRAALEERTRERVPLDWATTQNNLGNALRALGERESGTARLEEAVAAYRAALEEQTRERVPLDWAATQNNLGTALCDARRAGERDGAARGGGGGLPRGAGGTDARAGAARLGDDAEQSRQRARDARRAGERDGAARRRRSRPIARRWRSGRASGFRSTGRRRRTISATRSRALGERESGTARLEEAVAAYRAALEERTRERVPLDWARTQNEPRQRARSARRAGERDGAARGGGRGLSRGAGGMDARAGSARLGGDAEQSRQCAADARRAGERDGAAGGGGRGLSRGAGGADARAGSARLGGEHWQSGRRLDADRGPHNDAAVAETAVRQIETAYQTTRSGGQEQGAAILQAQLPKARAIRDRLKGQ